MTTLSMTDARQEFTELANKVMFSGMRICISKNNKPAFALVPLEDLQTLEALEDKIDLEEAHYRLENEIKLIEDAAIEIKTYENILEKLPDFSREDFENSEREYWERRLLKDAQQELLSTGSVGVGTMKSLEKLDITGVMIDQGGRVKISGKIETKGLIANEKDSNNS